MSQIRFRLNKFLLLWFAASTASACPVTKWSGEGHEFQICFKDHYFYSSLCENKKCGAIDFLSKAKNLHQPSESHHSATNPGSPICQELGGKVIIARNERGSEAAFCVAKDETAVALTSLARASK